MTLKSSAPETDLKGMLSSFEQKLGDDKVKAEQQKLDEAKPIPLKIAESLKTSDAPKRAAPGVAQPRVKKQVKRSIGDGL